MVQPITDPAAERIAELERRFAEMEGHLRAMEPPAPAAGGLGNVAANVLAALSKPDSVLMGQVRHYLGIGGAVLAAHGYASSSDAAMLTGFICAVVGCLWSIAVNYAVTHWLQVAQFVSPPVTADPVAQRAQLDAVVANMAAGPITQATVDNAVAVTEEGKV